jgi:hypothetical protein
MRAGRAILVVLPVAVLAAGQATARVYLTVQQALDAAFPPPAKVERRILYLDDEQARQAAAQAGAPVEARMVPYYVGISADRVTGYAYFDTHLVRTFPETVLILIAPEGALQRIDILSFDEPEDYLPGRRWLDQFPGRKLDDLGISRGIRALTGATLSARAITQAAKRVLVLHRLFVAATPARTPVPATEPHP